MPKNRHEGKVGEGKIAVLNCKGIYGSSRGGGRRREFKDRKEEGKIVKTVPSFLIGVRTIYSSQTLDLDMPNIATVRLGANTPGGEVEVVEKVRGGRGRVFKPKRTRKRKLRLFGESLSQKEENRYLNTGKVLGRRNQNQKRKG